MKVICVYNFDRETRSDRLIADNLTPEAAEALAAERNAKAGKHSEDFFRAVPDDHKLFTFQP